MSIVRLVDDQHSSINSELTDFHIRIIEQGFLPTSTPEYVRIFPPSQWRSDTISDPRTTI